MIADWVNYEICSDLLSISHKSLCPPPTAAAGLLALFSLFPWSLLSKAFADLARAAEDSGAGISWQQRYSYCQAGTPSPEEQAQLAYWTPNCTLPVAQALWVLVSG